MRSADRGAAYDAEGGDGVTLADYRVIGVTPDISELTFIGALKAAGSPALSAGHAVYQYCVKRGVSPSFIIAMFNRESGMGKAGTATITHSWGNTRLPTHGGVTPVRMTTPGEARSGQFPVFRDWIDGGIATVARFVDYAPYQGKTTVTQIIPTWAPATDGNDPTAYVRGVLAQMAAWRAQEAASAAKGGSVTGHVPKPPITNHIIGIPPKRDGVGVERLDSKRTPGATVLHSMAGTLGSCDNYFPGPDVEALTDFGIGQTNFNGSGFAQIIQWCEIRGTLMPWASGPVRSPQGDGPRFLAHFGGAAAVNNVGVSIEHDDTTLANGARVAPGEAAVTVYQWSASIWLQAYLHAEEFAQTAATYDFNMWHKEFCGSAYKECPRPRITDYVDDYQAAVKAIMRHHQEGVPYPSGGLIVAGMRINTPPSETVGKVPVIPAQQEVDVAVPRVGVTEVQIIGGQVVVVSNYGPDERDVVAATVNTQDQGVAMINKHGERYGRSQQQNTFKDFYPIPKS